MHISDIKQLVRIRQDEYEPELEVIAHVTAYFDIASKRIVDDIPTLFETKFALTFVKELEKNLHEKLKLVGDSGLENCKRYVRDDPSTQRRREDLSRQLAILSKAEETVNRFNSSN